MTRVNRELGYMRRHANLLKGYSVYPETSAGTGPDRKSYPHKL